MEALNIGVDSWIIQDGNYPDFAVGQETQFALEFYPLSLKPSQCKSPSAAHLNANRYRICGQITYRTETVWVLEMGFRAYQESNPPGFGIRGDWVEGEIYLGVDPFSYFETLKHISGMPSLTYSFRIEGILLETTPWLTVSKESDPGIMRVRDDKQESYREVPRTDAWNDDNGDAQYILKSLPIDDRR